MAILVTGGAGYIGSVVVEDLRNRDESVVVIDNLVYGHRKAVDAGVPFYEGNIGDKAGIRSFPNSKRSSNARGHGIRQTQTGMSNLVVK